MKSSWKAGKTVSEMIYIDTSIIVKLYFKEKYSRKAAAWLKKNNQAAALTRFHELEFINAIQLKIFRGEIAEDEAELVISKLEEHERKGVYYRPQLEWPTVLNIAMELSKNHSHRLGSRSLDIMHVASAIFLKADRFLSLDRRQFQIAHAAGLKLEKL